MNGPPSLLLSTFCLSDLSSLFSSMIVSLLIRPRVSPHCGWQREMPGQHAFHDSHGAETVSCASWPFHVGVVECLWQLKYVGNKGPRLWELDSDSPLQVSGPRYPSMRGWGCNTTCWPRCRRLWSPENGCHRLYLGASTAQCANETTNADRIV